MTEICTLKVILVRAHHEKYGANKRISLLRGNIKGILRTEIILRPNDSILWSIRWLRR